MVFTGYLSQFSLPELFQFLEEGYKTGLLTISKLSSSELTSSKLLSNFTTEAYYIWLQQGRILAAAEGLDNQGLISMLAKRGWYNNYFSLKDFDLKNSSSKTTMGLYLKSQGIVKAEQLMLLFRAQITEKISPLFQLKDAEFNFDSNAPLPLAEMTGLSIPATEATLMGLRSLQDWSQLAAKLPDPNSSILAKSQEKPRIRLEYTESQVWKYLDGTSPLYKISEELQLPLEKIRQIAFRMIISNLAEEVFMSKSANNTTGDRLKASTELDTSNLDTLNESKKLHKPQNIENLVTPADSKVLPRNKQSHNCENNSTANQTLDPELDAIAKTNVSKSFLQSLVSFLQDKIES